MNIGRSYPKRVLSFWEISNDTADPKPIQLTMEKSFSGRNFLLINEFIDIMLYKLHAVPK